MGILGILQAINPGVFSKVTWLAIFGVFSSVGLLMTGVPEFLTVLCTSPHRVRREVFELAMEIQDFAHSEHDNRTFSSRYLIRFGARLRRRLQTMRSDDFGIDLLQNDDFYLGAQTTAAASLVAQHLMTVTALYWTAK
jgi:hypothetical protein